VSLTTKRLTVAQYEQMVENGILPQTNRLELIEGRIVEKARQSPPQAFSSASCRDALAGLVPTGWHVRCGNPVRVPARDSEPEPDVSVVRGQIRDYCDHHPGPEDVALVVEVVRWDVAEERRLAATYGGGGIPVYWIVNVAGRQLEVYAHPAGGAYPAPTILGEPESVGLIIQGQVVGEIAVADLLPQAKGGGR
jgi:Uma2 family endonuclease